MIIREKGCFLKQCSNCRYWEREPVDNGHVCVNADSFFCSDWREEDDFCDAWGRKEDEPEGD